MKKRSLFIVNTPYQLMVSINLIKTRYSNTIADIVITNNIADFLDLAKRVRESKLFDRVYIYKIKNIYPDKNGVALIRRLINEKNIFNEKYDYYFFANLDHGASGVFRALKKNNKYVLPIMFEDGYATYSGWYSDFLTMFGSFPKDGNFCKRPFYKTLFHRYIDNVFCDVNKMFVFNPEIMTYIPPFDVERMEPIDTSNKELILLYNNIFNYDPSIDSYDEPIIFFEESYYADGYNINDIQIIESIAKIVGKEKILIKIHPRNPKNRFQKLGYKTNTNTSIPWEVICMNINLNNKILISIASVATIVPATMFGQKYRGLLLLKALQDDSCLKKNITNLYEKICEEHESLQILSSMDDLKEAIINWV